MSEEKKIKGRWWDISVPEKIEEVQAKRCMPWNLDLRGYFLIKVNYKDQQIELALCNNEHKIVKKIIGKHPIDIYQTLIKNDMISLMEHAADMGVELEKAYIALKNKIKYVQDSELDFNQKVEE